jgi:hypothetical protein
LESENMRRLFCLLGLGSLFVFLMSEVSIQAEHSVWNSVCDYYVDNNVTRDGDGSWEHPWNDINNHIGDLGPGYTMCVRGDVSGPGRVYEVSEIYLDSKGGTVRDGVPGSPITVRSYPGEKAILKNVGSNSIVYFRGADHWILEGFTMDHNGRDSRAVRFKYEANYNILRNNEIYNGKTDGIALYSGHNVGNVIENNHIHHFEAEVQGAHCIILEPGSDDTVIRGNRLHDCSNDGIQIYAVSDTSVSEYSRNVHIVDNVFYRGTLPRSDDGLDIKGADGLAVTGNEFYGYYTDDEWSGRGRAIVIQKGSRNLVFDSNTIYGTSYGIDCHGEGGKHPENVTIKNNMFYNIGGPYVIALSDVYDVAFYHNTIANAVGYSFRVGGKGLHGGDIRNNLFYSSGKADVSDDAPFTDVTVGYNGWFDTESNFTAPTDIMGSGDPGFVDAANNDYHLLADSPVRDVGIDVGVATDFEGDLRPFGDRPDVGADEYVPVLYLRATPQDRAIGLSWTQFDHPALDSYVITYTYGTGGRPAKQGSSPIEDVLLTVQTYSLTDVSNYVFYTVTLAARDGSDADLVVSNSVRVMPTDIFMYLPLTMKRAL